MNTFELPDTTRPSRLRIRVRDKKRALAFYCDLLGLHESSASTSDLIVLGSSDAPEFLELEINPNALQKPAGSAGLFHQAILYPSRQDLARVLRRLLHHRYPLQGAADHLVSEAIYLADPEGNGVELYVDRPANQWQWHGDQVEMETLRLDIDDLLATDSKADRTLAPPDNARLGHIHLQTLDLGKAAAFYRDFLGLPITQSQYPGALFFAAGRYHHHLGVNSWGVRREAETTATGLVSYRFDITEPEAIYCLQQRAPLAGYHAEITSPDNAPHALRIRDPNGLWLELQSGSPVR